MSRHQVIECDRCGAVGGESNADRAKWGRVYAASLSNVDKVGTSETPADLCGGCMDSLVDFMGGRSLVEPDSVKSELVKEKA